MDFDCGNITFAYSSEGRNVSTLTRLSKITEKDLKASRHISDERVRVRAEPLFQNDMIKQTIPRSYALLLHLSPSIYSGTRSY